MTIGLEHGDEPAVTDPMPAVSPQEHWQRHNDHRFRAPVDLALSPLQVSRVLIVGSCFASALNHFCERVFPGAACDHLPYNFVGELPAAPAHPIGEYAFQLVVLPLRSVMPEAMFFNLRRHDDLAGFERVLAESELRLMHMLNGATGYGVAHGLPTLIANFMLPQQNSMGRLLAQNDARNPVWFVGRLNAVIAERAAAQANTYVMDIDGIAASIGRRHIQDDIIAMNSHNVFISDWDFPHDRNRLHPPASIMQMHAIKTDEFILGIWAEAAAMLRTIRQQDGVKLVIIDLDDTLWRGVIAEEAFAEGAGMDADGQTHGFAAQEDHGVAAAANPADGARAFGGGDDVAGGEFFDGAVAIGGGDEGAGEDADDTVRGAIGDAVVAAGPEVDGDGATAIGAGGRSRSGP